MRVLQTLALPTWPRRRVNKTRAGNGIRTRDLLLGKETFYQLNHARIHSYYFVNVFDSIALVKKIVKRFVLSPPRVEICPPYNKTKTWAVHSSGNLNAFLLRFLRDPIAGLILATMPIVTEIKYCLPESE
jgi:hypothetical protein